MCCGEMRLLSIFHSSYIKVLMDEQKGERYSTLSSALTKKTVCVSLQASRRQRQGQGEGEKEEGTLLGNSRSHTHLHTHTHTHIHTFIITTALKFMLSSSHKIRVDKLKTIHFFSSDPWIPSNVSYIII